MRKGLGAFGRYPNNHHLIADVVLMDLPIAESSSLRRRSGEEPNANRMVLKMPEGGIWIWLAFGSWLDMW